MRVLKDQTGVQAPDADYLKGRIKNNQTLINEEVNGDIIEFFQKLVSLAGITENGNPDNESNGHQLLDALRNQILDDGAWTEVPAADYGIHFSPRLPQPNSLNLSYRKTKNGYLHLRGYFSSDATVSNGQEVFQLPSSDLFPVQLETEFLCGFSTSPVRGELFVLLNNGKLKNTGSYTDGTDVSVNHLIALF